jgi:hypothetical protein
MRSSLLSFKIAFLLLAFFAVNWQCAAQCALEPCHEPETKVPPCHRQHSTKHEAPAHSCKVPIFVSEEVQTHSADTLHTAEHLLLTLPPQLPGFGILVDGLGGQLWQPPNAPSHFETSFITPLRI